MAEEKKLQRKASNGSDEDCLTLENIDQLKVVTGRRVKLIIFGEEMIEKRVNASGNSGRVYLPPEWVGHKVKITRID